MQAFGVSVDAGDIAIVVTIIFSAGGTIATLIYQGRKTRDDLTKLMDQFVIHEKQNVRDVTELGVRLTGVENMLKTSAVMTQ